MVTHMKQVEYMEQGIQMVTKQVIKQLKNHKITAISYNQANMLMIAVVLWLYTAI